MSTSSPRFGSTGSPPHREPARPTPVAITTPQITLGEFLKWAGIAPTGGHAKVLVQDGHVAVNGTVERRRGRRLMPGDRIAAGGREYQVVAG